MRTALALVVALNLCGCTEDGSRAVDRPAQQAPNEAEAHATPEAQRACTSERDALASALAANDAELTRLRTAQMPEGAQALAAAEAAHTRIAAELETKTLACQRLMRDPGSR